MAGFKSLLSISISVIFAMSPVYSFAEGEVKATGGDKGAITDATKSEVARTKVSSGDYTKQAGEFKTASTNLLNAAEQAFKDGATVSSIADIRDADSAASYYANLHSTCVKTQGTASWLCREETSPQLQSTLNQVNTVASLISGVAITDACSNLAKMARLATGGLTAYTAACSSARAACEGACATVKNNLDRVKELGAKITSVCIPPVDPVKGPAAQKSCSALATAHQNYMSQYNSVILEDSKIANTASIALRDKACTYEYTSMIASAGAGIVSLVNSFKQGKQCEEESDGTGTTDPTAVTQADKCAMAENANTQECICFVNPRTTGCGNSYSKLDAGDGDSLSPSIGAMSAGDGVGSPNFGDGIGTEMTHAERNPSSGGGGLPGAPTGGGAGLGGSGGAGGGAGRSAASEGKAETPSYETGVEGGGGGRGGFGGGGMAGGSGNKYRSYLPGGEKDPAKAMAGSEAWKKEVTGQAGKSNFEKVSDRYRDNNTTLLNK